MLTPPVHVAVSLLSSGFAFLLLFQSIHQFSLGYASSQSLVLQSHEIEYYEHNFMGVLAWLMGGLSHIARTCLLWDVMRAHGHDMGGGTIFLLLSSFFVILAYFFFAYRNSLSAKVAAISAALTSIFLAISLFHAASLNHVAPGAAIGAAVGLWLYALLGKKNTIRLHSLTADSNCLSH